MSWASMRYDLRLSLGTDYPSASDRVRLLSHVLPRALPGRQSVLSQELTVTPTPTERRDFQDFFGNTATMVAFHNAVSGVQFDLRAQIACNAPAEWLDFSPDLDGLREELATARGLQGDMPAHFLGPSARVPVIEAISNYAAPFRTGPDTTLGCVVGIGQSLNNEMSFDAASTDVDTPTEEAFARREGVCQDYSHIMIGALRALGIPAGYVSGFLRTEPPPGQPRLEGADAMHAWVRAWCGREMGWVEYDPTNACFAGTDHVVVGFGRDYADVAPIQGVMMTSGPQSSHHSVDMIPV